MNIRISLFRILTITAMAAAAFESAGAQPDPLRIGVIGTGNVGGTLARHWAAAGHEIVISSRNPQDLELLAAELGPRVRSAFPREAAEFGEVVLIAVPYGALPQIGRDLQSQLSGKIVLDAGNPYVYRDGDVAEEALERGTGVVSAQYLSGTRLVRAFNAVSVATMRDQSNRPAGRLAIPIAGDDADAIAVAERLVHDAGFEAVLVGGLDEARIFDPNQPLYGIELTAAETREFLNSLNNCWGWVASVSARFCRWFF